MLAAELLLALLIVVAVLVTISRRIRVPYPVLLLIGGLVVGLVPGIPRLELDPEIVFLVVLPPLLYVSAFLTPIRDFRANLKNISSLAIGLVAVSAGVVAVLAMSFVPGMTWPLAAALGAIVSPPDAVAATAIAQRLAVPRRVVSILEGESLLNDATALTIYRAALGAAAAGITVSVVGSLASFVFVALGGILIGLVVGWITSWVRIHLTDTPVEITVSLITPYAAYLPAELLGVSGVLAAVTAGLFLGRRSSVIMGSEARLAGRAVWESLVFLLTGVVFLAIGFQISSISREMDRATLLQLAAVGVVVSLALIVVRAVWVFGLSLRDLLAKDQRRSRLRESIVLSWAGMRGVVSLAAALAIPIALPGNAVSARDAIIIITFTVILVTLVGQGLTLPLVIRAAGLGGDAEDGHEESHARQELIEEALRRIDDLEKGYEIHAIAKLKAGCAFQTYYPISPATDESVFLERQQRDYNLLVVQCEDEISSINMAVGAAHMGVRAATATSGPGFALMVEGIGFASITECPGPVLVMYQRGGPSTGMPTRQEQGDLQFALHPAQGDFPHLVIAPGDLREAYQDTFSAFNWAERYQMPIIVLSDKKLASVYTTIDKLELRWSEIDRGEMFTGSEWTAVDAKGANDAGTQAGHNGNGHGKMDMANVKEYLRYAFAKDGISPRSRPGTKGGRYWITSDEHDPDGHITEGVEMRVAMMEKRMGKLKLAQDAIPEEQQFFLHGPKDADLTVLGWGSTKGTILDALKVLESQGKKINFLQCRLMRPFPSKAVGDILRGAKRIVSMEENYSGQLAQVVQEQTGVMIDQRINKFDGRPFSEDEIVNALAKVYDGAKAEPVVTYVH